MTLDGYLTVGTALLALCALLLLRISVLLRAIAAACRQRDSHAVINEGHVKKNLNDPPTTPRPAPPKAQVAPKRPPRGP